MQLLLAVTLVLLWYPAPAMGADGQAATPTTQHRPDALQAETDSHDPQTDDYRPVTPSTPTRLCIEHSLADLQTQSADTEREKTRLLQRLEDLQKRGDDLNKAIKRKKDIIPLDIKTLILTYALYKDDAIKMTKVYPKLTIRDNFMKRPGVYVQGAGTEECNGWYVRRDHDEELPEGFDLMLRNKGMPVRHRTELRNGVRILCHWRTKHADRLRSSGTAKATVQYINYVDTTINILFTDGTYQNHIPADWVVKVVFAEGDDVEAERCNDWYPGIIRKLNEDGTCDVEWFGEDTHSAAFPEDKLRKPQRSWYQKDSNIIYWNRWRWCIYYKKCRYPDYRVKSISHAPPELGWVTDHDGYARNPAPTVLPQRPAPAPPAQTFPPPQHHGPTKCGCTVM